jgi:nucleoside-diphosphate-sugar epimerase
MAASAVRKLGLQAPPQHEPAAYWQARHGDWAAGYCLDQVVDSGKAVRELGWQPAFRRD